MGAHGLPLHFSITDKLYYEQNMLLWANPVRPQFIYFCGKSIPSLKQLAYRHLEHDLFVY